MKFGVLLRQLAAPQAQEIPKRTGFGKCSAPTDLLVKRLICLDYSALRKVVAHNHSRSIARGLQDSEKAPLERASS